MSWLKQAKKRPNLTKLTLTGMPAGRGRKGGVTPRSKKKSLPSTSRTPLIVHSEFSSSSNSPSSGTTSVSDAAPVSALTPTVRPLTSSSVPPFPPPFVPCSPMTSSAEGSPFILSFVTGNIRVCRGCRQKYVKPAQPPIDLCVRHQEWHEFFPPGSSCAQMRFGNVYYHCNVPCIKARHPNFHPDMLIIQAIIAAQLLPVHSEYLSAHMGRI